MLQDCFFLVRIKSFTHGCCLGQSKLSAVLRTYKDALITNIKSTIKTVVAELLPILFTRSPDAGEAPSPDRQADTDG